MSSSTEWWRSAVVYQLYIWSFADGDGDGLGDLAGLRQRLGYIAELGVDAVWINPWYPSPRVDGGYDVADYHDLDPRVGTLADGEAFIAEAHGAGLRVLLDLVPNHTSDRHNWFEAALASPPGHETRDRYWFRPGRGRDGDEPPNNWRSIFGGRAWTRVPNPDGRPGEWYLHLFAPGQPDLNWENDDVKEHFDETLRFWFDRGVDGFRVDVAHGLAKDPALPDLAPGQSVDRGGDDHPYLDRDDVHDVYRRWRKIADSYDPPRVFVGETWVHPPDRLTRFVRSDELHSSFTFELINARWTADELRAAIDRSIATVEPTGAPVTWVLGNHDVARQISRYGRDQRTVHGHNLDHLLGLPFDADLGRRRARAAALVLLALPGSVYLYQGEELGLEEVEDLPEEALTDPTWERSGGTLRGRDGCRVPLPWAGHQPPYDFGPPDSEPWLPQPHDWADRTVEAQLSDDQSFLTLYRKALSTRQALRSLRSAELEWVQSEPTAIAFRRPGLICVVNFGPHSLEPPTTAQPLVASSDLLAGEHLPPESAAWYADTSS